MVSKKTQVADLEKLGQIDPVAGQVDKFDNLFDSMK